MRRLGALTDRGAARHSSSMRNLRLLALVAPVFLLPLACEDSNGSSSGATFNPEAGSFEAGPSPEGGSPTPEAGQDATPPAPLGVTVTVLLDAAPKANVRVILQDATGAVTGEQTTDATGKVSLPTAPGMVTVLTANGTGGGSSVAPVTFVGVADGDKLVVAGTSDVQVDPVVVGTYTALFNAGGAATNASFFNVYAGDGCNNSSAGATTSLSVNLFPSCLAAKNSLLANVTDNNGALLGFAFAKDLNKPPAGPPPGNIDVGPLTFAAPGSTKLAATNVPQTVNTYGQLYAVGNGVLFEMTSSDGILEAAGGADYKTPTGFAEGYQATVSFNSYNAQSTSVRRIVRREAVPANNVLTNIDFTSALPAITDAPLTKPTPERPEVTLTSAGPLTASDGAVATLHWNDSIAETNGSWTFVLPPSTTGFKVPALPADAATFLPKSNVSCDEVIFFEATQLPGYKELKSIPVQPNFGPSLLDTRKALPLPGTVRVTQWFPGIPG